MGGIVYVQNAGSTDSDSLVDRNIVNINESPSREEEATNCIGQQPACRQSRQWNREMLDGRTSRA